MHDDPHDSTWYEPHDDADTPTPGVFETWRDVAIFFAVGMACWIVIIASLVLLLR